MFDCVKSDSRKLISYCHYHVYHYKNIEINLVLVYLYRVSILINNVKPVYPLWGVLRLLNKVFG
jgi:hypothetical protein